MEVWRLWQGQGGYEVELVEAPGWALVLSRGVEALDGAMDHFFCSAPDWLWRIPLGRPVYEDDFLANSLAGALYGLFNWAVFAEYRHARILHRFAVPDELAHALGAEADDSDEGTS